MNININWLIERAAEVNAAYRVDQSTERERALELGFLYGTAEFIIAITGLMPHESYSEKRQQLAEVIDQKAGRESYPILGGTS